MMFTLIVSMLLIPIQAYIVPLFLLVSELKLLNTFAALILVAGANVTSVYILTSFFKRIPNELEEAARIDGCKDFGIFAKIMLPLTKPAVSTVTILMFISNWNNFLWPMIAIRENALKPLTVGIAQFMGGANSTAPVPVRHVVGRRLHGDYPVDHRVSVPAALLRRRDYQFGDQRLGERDGEGA
ncbi:hypothetical protein HMSSN036_60940 [Paenibacillus macerans]|nr:hypothetical protein HMSSN036_60940 [Paenibacillus macerans]